MNSSEVQRTLVKSPPELWAEISDPAALARHLDAFGEIRITRVDPEQRVEWEADDASGSVLIKPSGWGTKVKLTATRPVAEPEDAAEPDDVADEPELAQEPDTEAPVDDTSELDAIADLDVVQETHVEPELEHAPALEPEPRRGFFARLFGRRRMARADEPTGAAAAPEKHATEPPVSTRYNALAVWASQIESHDDRLTAPDAVSAEDASLGDRVETEPHAETVMHAGTKLDVHMSAKTEESSIAHAQSCEPTDEGASAHDDTSPDSSAEIETVEEAAADEVTAVLTGMLDRLGAAHHRPFSRS